MASFDLQTFLQVKGTTGVGNIKAIGMAYGLPSCMLALPGTILSYFPSDTLSQILGETASSKTKANQVAGETQKKVMLDSGVTEFATDQGNFKYKSNSSKIGTDNDEGQGTDNNKGVGDAFKVAIDGAVDIYQNVKTVVDDFNMAAKCLDDWNQTEEFQQGNAATQRATMTLSAVDPFLYYLYDGDRAKLANAADHVAKCNITMSNINTILGDRAADPSLEPRFLDITALDAALSGTTFIRVPADDPGLPEEEVFRLTYGPPLTTGGQYILTSDGLYYDSQAGGLSSIYLAISGVIPPGDKWKYNYDPNLGGKGDAVSIDSLNKFSDNMFDLDLIDDSKGMQTYYDLDHFLSVLKQQRDKHVYDLSGDLVSFIGTYGEDSSIVRNERQLIISELANHNSKIDRRKKQIEVAVKAPQVYGDADAPIFPPGDIPINDFSFLEPYNLVVKLDQQKALIFEEGEVEGMVYPINPVFTISAPKPPGLTFQHLHVPTVGKGSIIYTPTGSPSGTVLSLTDLISEDSLFSIYNFLETKVVVPSSTDFFVTNCATEDMYNNAKLVSTSTSSLFFSGLAIPFLDGIVKNKSTDTAAASALGSFVRLPDTQEYQDLTYNPSGFSMEFWSYVPNIMNGEVGWLSSTTSALTKAILSCENVGATVGSSALDETGAPSDLDYLENVRGGNFNRGMICGFTRDRRITQDAVGYSNSNYDNDPASSLSFFIAPTQARDSSSASWINNDISGCGVAPTFYKMKVDLSSNTLLGNVSSQFVLFNITVSPQTNTIKFYADGTLLATSSIDTVFGVEPYKTINLPSFKNNNSFEYSSTTVDGPSTLQQGPRLGNFYTPWIVGGGYTDGMYKSGNFLGGDRGGIVSSYRGHLGSLKFYSKPLNTNEVLKNYNAQQGFFKSILI